MEPNNCGFQNQVSNLSVQECLAVMHNRWYLDSGCSRHMTGDKTKFCLLTENDGKNPFKHVMRIQLKNERSKKNNKLIYNTKAQLKNQESKSISVKQAWIPKYLFNVLDTLKDLNETK